MKTGRRVLTIAVTLGAVLAGLSFFKFAPLHEHELASQSFYRMLRHTRRNAFIAHIGLSQDFIQDSKISKSDLIWLLNTYRWLKMDGVQTPRLFYVQAEMDTAIQAVLVDAEEIGFSSEWVERLVLWRTRMIESCVEYNLRVDSYEKKRTIYKVMLLFNTALGFNKYSKCKLQKVDRKEEL